MAVSRQAPESQFAYVVVVSRRARQLMIGGRPLVENPRSRKTSRIAEEELLLGLLEYETPELPADGKRRQAPQVAARAGASCWLSGRRGAACCALLGTL